jgi:NAD(P)-dependent dehydrogenase (short-subunit alcohol dehydrogenase family)
MAHPAFDLTGKVVLITGGNSGIGLGMAEGLAKAGADVCIWGTNKEKNATAVKQLEQYGVRAVSLACDVSDEQAVDKAFAESVERLGRVDTCFANAGVPPLAPSFAEMTSEEWRRVLRVNLDGAFFTFRAAVRHMIERRGGGSLVATSSLSAMEGQARGQHYASTKGGVVSMAKAIAVEYARNGIRANAIVPGWIETPMTSPVFNMDRFRDKVLPRVPFRRWGTGADFEGIAVYLASDASAYHTGDVFVIDGGYAIF